MEVKQTQLENSDTQSGNSTSKTGNRVGTYQCVKLDTQNRILFGLDLKI